VLSEADERSIRSLHDAWIEAEQRSDVEGVLNLCTENVEWVPPDGPVIFGPDAGRRLLLTPDIRLLSIQVMDFAVDGAERRATKVCRYKTVFELTETRIRGVALGTHTWKLEKDDDRWRVASVSWQLDREDEVPSSTSSSVG
jgi:uncharacterized protein (TIGR02246 family)